MLTSRGCLLSAHRGPYTDPDQSGILRQCYLPLRSKRPRALESALASFEVIAMSTSTATLTPRPMLHALAKNWWLLLLRGIAAIVFGVLAFAWPGLTLVTLVLFYAAFRGSAKPVPTWWLVVVGILGIGAGIATFVMPGLTAVLLILFIGAWALVHGIFEIIGAIQLRK